MGASGVTSSDTETEVDAPIGRIPIMRQVAVLLTGAFSAAPARTIAWLALVALQAVLPSALMVILGKLLDSLSGQGEIESSALAALVTTFIALEVAGPVMSLLSLDLGMAITEREQGRITEEMVGRADLEHVEDQRNLRDASVASELAGGPSGPPLFVGIRVFGAGAGSVLSGVVAAFALAGYSWWVATVLMVSWLLVGVLLRDAVSSDAWDSPEVADTLRESEQSYEFTTSARFAKEVRVFRLQSWVSRRLDEAHRILLSYDRGRADRWRVWVAGAVVVMANGTALGFAYHLGSTGAAPVGALVAYCGLLATVSNVATMDFYWSLDLIARPLPAARRVISRVRDRSAMPDGDREPTDAPHGVTFENVRFGYGPSTVLDDVSFTIPAGTSAALVGLNGAGKSTIIKLLCRFYDPQAGRILIDGDDLRSLRIASWRAGMAVAFQRLTRYPWSVGENIVPLASDPLAAAADARSAGVSGVSDLTKMTGSEFGGVELSGGQWQKIGVARTLARVRTGATMIVLDEPTAQMDVKAEKEIFERLLDETRGRTVLLVSHRLAAARHADRILVLSQGRIAEEGTHDELMALGGQYSRLYGLQAGAYEEAGDDD